MKPKIIYLNQWMKREASDLIREFGDETHEISEADAVVGLGMKVDHAFLEKYPKLKVISLTSVGYDNADVDALTRKGIPLTNTPDILTEATADLGFALLMSTGRRIVESMDYMRQDRWKASIGEDLFSTGVYGKKLGVIGFGRIGQALARRGKLGFNMDVSYYSRNEARGYGFEAKWKKMDEVLSESDYVCVTAPLTSETRGLIGAREFGLMKRSGILINISRGPVLDENALIEALQKGVIRGAGLDVFEREPLDFESPFFKLPQVVMTPHIGSATSETRIEMLKMAFKNAKQALSGQTPDQLVNKELAKK